MCRLSILCASPVPTSMRSHSDGDSEDDGVVAVAGTVRMTKWTDKAVEGGGDRDGSGRAVRSYMYTWR